MSLYPTAYEYDYVHQLNPGGDIIPDSGEKIQPIQPVVSLRADDPANQYKQPIVNSQIYDNYMNSNDQQPRENFEPADMELGDSDEDDSHIRHPNPRFLKVIDTHTDHPNDSHLLSTSQMNSSLPYSGMDHDSHYSHLPHHKNLPPRPLNRNITQAQPHTRHHYPHPNKIDDRNSEPLDSRWSSTGRSDHPFPGPGHNKYSQSPGARQWKPPHNLRGSYNRRY